MHVEEFEYAFVLVRPAFARRIERGLRLKVKPARVQKLFPQLNDRRAARAKTRDLLRVR